MIMFTPFQDVKPKNRWITIHDNDISDTETIICHYMWLVSCECSATVCKSHCVAKVVYNECQDDE